MPPVNPIFGDIGMGGQDIAQIGGSACHNIHQSHREQLRNHADRFDKRERATFRRLDHHAIPGQQCRNDMQKSQRDRSIPGHD